MDNCVSTTPRANRNSPTTTPNAPTGLLEKLGEVPDPRHFRGIRHSLVPLLAVAALATLCGAVSLVAIDEFAKELSQEQLTALGFTRSSRTGQYRAPSGRTIGRVLRAIDRDAFDLVVNAWVAEQTKACGTEDELPALAVDGKALRGARLPEGGQVHLLSAMTHSARTVVAQRDVDGKTNEITEFQALLEGLDIGGATITADALLAQRVHAEFLADRDAYFIFGLKGNQPNLASAAAALLDGIDCEHQTHDRGHGRVDHRYTRTAILPEETAVRLGFASAKQVVAVDRERADLADRMTSSETSYYVTSLSPDDATPEQLASLIRGHWGIENSLHWVRDVTFTEDKSTVRKGSTPQALATLRNLAISLLRLSGFENIARGLRWAARDITRALTLLLS